MLEQFKHGPLRAADVGNPVSCADAFGQVFFAWVRRQMSRQYKRLNFQPCLFDLNAAQDAVEHQCDTYEFPTTSPLLLVRLSCRTSGSLRWLQAIQLGLVQVATVFADHLFPEPAWRLRRGRCVAALTPRKSKGPV